MPVGAVFLSKEAGGIRRTLQLPLGIAHKQSQSKRKNIQDQDINRPSTCSVVGDARIGVWQVVREE